MSFKSGFQSRERASQFNTASGSEFQVRGAVALNDRLANDVRRNGTRSSGTDDDRVLRALVRNEMCWLCNSKLLTQIERRSWFGVRMSESVSEYFLNDTLAHKKLFQ